jgi:ATP-dependent Clp protease protease subunit|tara:strand:- start:20198 stop:20842 length:645 start_codon:yes stop_codon:yes gene_type:complete
MSDIIESIHCQNIDLKQREIYLHGQHGSFEDDPGVEYRMATTFVKNIRHLDYLKNEPILVHMHSLGGNWGDGMAIFDAIKICRSHVTILVYGQAESMSSIILQAADKRIMMPNSYFMCHYGSSASAGSYLDTQNWANFEQKILDTMLDIYTERATKGKYFKEKYSPTTEEKVKRFFKRKLKDGDWYLNSHEAVYYGLADNVITHRSYGSINSLK